MLEGLDRPSVNFDANATCGISAAPLLKQMRFAASEISRRL